MNLYFWIKTIFISYQLTLKIIFETNIYSNMNFDRIHDSDSDFSSSNSSSKSKTSAVSEATLRLGTESLWRLLRERSFPLFI